MSGSPRRRDFRSTLKEHERLASGTDDSTATPPTYQATTPMPSTGAASPSPASRASLGTSPGQPALHSTAGARPLGTSGSVLPELAEAPASERKWWRHPAFLVSIGLTVLALAGAATWFIISAVNDDSVAVSGLTLQIEDGNAHLDWSGPDAAYSLYAVHGSGEVVDLTQFVHGGTEAWVYSAAGLYEDDTCFVVRPTSSTGDVALDAETLSAQRGQSACVTDATP
ncbi:hypothetical protein [Agromyces sp. NPDC056965]|uniref:hypothetical protein n=1 Tax=Agromyces sp. NPDC056965 TaxID=3345983 RepID=UPI0036414BDE